MSFALAAEPPPYGLSKPGEKSGHAPTHERHVQCTYIPHTESLGFVSDERSGDCCRNRRIDASNTEEQQSWKTAIIRTEPGPYGFHQQQDQKML